MIPLLVAVLTCLSLLALTRGLTLLIWGEPSHGAESPRPKETVVEEGHSR